MRFLLYPLFLVLIVLVLLSPTVGVAIFAAWWWGLPGLLVFLLVPAAALLVRSVRCREPHAWAWFALGAFWAFLVWLALPVSLWMSLTRPRAAAPSPRRGE